MSPPTSDPIAESGVASSSDLAGLASSVLATQLGYTPRVTCPTGDIPIEQGASLICTVTLDTAAIATAVVTLTEVTGSNYDITVVVG